MYLSVAVEAVDSLLGNVCKVQRVANPDGSLREQEARGQLLERHAFTDDVAEFIHQCDRVYVVEQNRDGQMFGLMRMEMDPALSAKLRSVRHFNGLPIDAIILAVLLLIGLTLAVMIGAAVVLYVSCVWLLHRGVGTRE